MNVYCICSSQNLLPDSYLITFNILDTLYTEQGAGASEVECPRVWLILGKLGTTRPVEFTQPNLIMS